MPPMLPVLMSPARENASLLGISVSCRSSSAQHRVAHSSVFGQGVFGQFPLFNKVTDFLAQRMNPEWRKTRGRYVGLEAVLSARPVELSFW
jgi:hypothetical protein